MAADIKREPEVRVGVYESPLGVIWYVRWWPEPATEWHPTTGEPLPRVALFGNEQLALSYGRKLRHDLRTGQTQ